MLLCLNTFIHSFIYLTVNVTWVFFVTADAYDSSRMLCEQYYLMSPEVEMEQVNCK